MRAVVSDGAVGFSEQLDVRELGALPGEARGDVGDLLAEGGGRRRLSMGPRQHRAVCVLVGQRAQRGNQLVHAGKEEALSGLAQHQRVAEVVDVLGGAGEVYELRDGRELVPVGELRFEEVLHRLDVVVGGRLDLLDAAGVGLVEVVDEPLEIPVGLARERGHLADARMVGQGREPAHLDEHAQAHQSELTEDRVERYPF